MRNLLRKIKILFLPALALSAAYTIAVTLLSWVAGGTAPLPFDENIQRYWLPAGIAGLLMHLFVSSRLRFLKFPLGSNIPFFYGLVVWTFVAVPALLAGSFVDATQSELGHVQTASQIPSLHSRYLSLEEICLHRSGTAAHFTAEAVGRYNEDLKFIFYVAVPLCSPNGHTDVWLGLEYNKTINNRLSDAQKDAEYKSFALKIEGEVNAEDGKRFQYFERIGLNSERHNLQKALDEAGYKEQNPIFIIGHTTPYDPGAHRKLVWALGTFGAGAALWFILCVFSPLRRKPRRDSDSTILALQFLIPSPRNYGAPLLIDANIVVYAAMAGSGLGIVSFGADDLIQWGGNYGPLLQGTGWLRLVTSQFVHGGLMHLASNLYGLVFAIIYLSPVLNNWRLIVCYLVAGIGASIASAVNSPDIVSVGASGSIFGLFGILLMLLALRDNRLVLSGTGLLTSIGVYVLLNIGLGAATPGIDNAGHIGGLATGLVLGAIIYLLGRAKSLQGDADQGDQ